MGKYNLFEKPERIDVVIGSVENHITGSNDSVNIMCVNIVTIPHEGGYRLIDNYKFLQDYDDKLVEAGIAIHPYGCFIFAEGTEFLTELNPCYLEFNGTVYSNVEPEDSQFTAGMTISFTPIEDDTDGPLG